MAYTVAAGPVTCPAMSMCDTSAAPPGDEALRLSQKLATVSSANHFQVPADFFTPESLPLLNELSLTANWRLSKRIVHACIAAGSDASMACANRVVQTHAAHRGMTKFCQSLLALDNTRGLMLVAKVVRDADDKLAQKMSNDILKRPLSPETLPLWTAFATHADPQQLQSMLDDVCLHWPVLAAHEHTATFLRVVAQRLDVNTSLAACDCLLRMPVGDAAAAVLTVFATGDPWNPWATYNINDRVIEARQLRGHLADFIARSAAQLPQLSSVDFLSKALSSPSAALRDGVGAELASRADADAEQILARALLGEACPAWLPAACSHAATLNLRRQLVSALWPSGGPLPVDAAYYAALMAHAPARARVFDLLVGLPPTGLVEALRLIPAVDLLGAQHSLVPRLMVAHPETFAALKAGAYLASNPMHQAAAYLLQFDSPFWPKYLMEQPRNYSLRGWENVFTALPRSALQMTPTQSPQAYAECLFAAYEARCLHDTILIPAAARAKSMGIPLMVVANLSCGGTSLAPFSRRDMARLADRFVATKMSSHDAHGNLAVLNASLFTPEDVQYMAEHKPLVVVVDNTQKSRYPDGLWGYRNYACVLNYALNAQHTTIQCPAQGYDASTLCSQANGHQLHLNLQDWLGCGQGASSSTLAPRPPFAVHFMSQVNVRRRAMRQPVANSSWSDVQGPAFVLVHAGLTQGAVDAAPTFESFLTRGKASPWQHQMGFFDDSALQGARVYLGKRGYPKITPLLAPTARQHARHLQAGPPPKATAALIPHGSNPQALNHQALPLAVPLALPAAAQRRARHPSWPHHRVFWRRVATTLKGKRS